MTSISLPPSPLPIYKFSNNFLLLITQQKLLKWSDVLLRQSRVEQSKTTWSVFSSAGTLHLIDSFLLSFCSSHYCAQQSLILFGLLRNWAPLYQVVCRSIRDDRYYHYRILKTLILSQSLFLKDRQQTDSKCSTII